MWYIIWSAKFTAESTKNYASQVNQVLNRCFFSVFSENCEGVSKIFRLPITHVFCCILCDNSVLLPKEGWKLVSTLDSLVEEIIQKGKAIKFIPQRGFIQKSSRMHVKISLFRCKMCHNKDYEENFSVQMYTFTFRKFVPNFLKKWPKIKELKTR